MCVASCRPSVDAGETKPPAADPPKESTPSDGVDGGDASVQMWPGRPGPAREVPPVRTAGRAVADGDVRDTIAVELPVQAQTQLPSAWVLSVSSGPQLESVVVVPTFVRSVSVDVSRGPHALALSRFECPAGCTDWSPPEDIETLEATAGTSIADFGGADASASLLTVHRELDDGVPPIGWQLDLAWTRPGGDSHGDRWRIPLPLTVGSIGFAARAGSYRVQVSLPALDHDDPPSCSLGVDVTETAAPDIRLQLATDGCTLTADEP